jgi:hypothetical protein
MIRPDLPSAIAAAESVVALAASSRTADAGDKTLVDLPRT